MTPEERDRQIAELKPYYQRDGITIYLGDARQIVPILEVETIITDPVWPNATAQLVGMDDPFGLLRDVLEVIPRSAKRLAIQLGVDSDPRFLGAVPTWWRFFRLCWLDVAQPNYKGRLLDGATPAYLFGDPPKPIPGRMLISGMFRCSSNKGKANTHPCPRKISHLQWIVRQWSDEGDTILDPFCGSGTTLRAAKDLGRKAIGIEIVEEYAEMAANYMAQGVLQYREEAVPKKKIAARGFLKPTEAEVRAYCQERRNHVDPQTFVDFYESKGWRVGSSPMKDWKASVRTWEKRHANGATNGKAGLYDGLKEFLQGDG